jgi:transposase-like protein
MIPDIGEILTFTPPFCPNPWCPFHRLKLNRYRWNYRDGVHHTQAFGSVPRFTCRFCHAHFSRQSFRMDYYVKRPVSYFSLITLLCNSFSIRAIGRSCGLSCDSVTNRIHRLSRQCIALHTYILELQPTQEDLCVDELRSFTRSPSFPYTLSFLVGCKSQLFYTFNYVPGHACTVENSFPELLSLFVKQKGRSSFPLTIFSYAKQEYTVTATDVRSGRRPGIDAGQLIHQTVKYRKGETPGYPLGAAIAFIQNLRNDLAMYRRESVCYSRNVSNGLARIFCYAFFHNYSRTFRVANNFVRDARTVEFGKKRISDLIESWRIFLSHVNLQPVMEKVWRRSFPSPLKTTPEYLPAYVVRVRFSNSS